MVEVEKREKVLILYSGGADSRLMLEMAKDLGLDIHCLLIDYGQLHLKELVFAREQIRHINCPVQVHEVSLDGLNLESALTGTGEQGVYGDKDKISIWHVPGRNSLFAGIALSVAENNGCSVVWHGADFSDRLHLFPDCYQDYVVAVADMYKFGASYLIRYEAPLMGMTKEVIMGLLNSRGITQDQLHSGYGDITEKE